MLKGLLEDDQVITPQLAKMMGLEDYDPDNPPKMSDILFAQFTKTTQQITGISSASRAKIQQRYDEIFAKGGSKLNPEQQVSVDEIVKILQMYPKFIAATKITLSTILRRELEISELLSADPTAMLDLMGKIQEMLMEEIPESEWPEKFRAPKEEEEPSSQTVP